MGDKKLYGELKARPKLSELGSELRKYCILADQKLIIFLQLAYSLLFGYTMSNYTNCSFLWMKTYFTVDTFRHVSKNGAPKGTTLIFTVARL